jgi:hypothetical protein
MAGRPLPPLVATHILSTLQRSNAAKQGPSVRGTKEGTTGTHARKPTNDRIYHHPTCVTETLRNVCGSCSLGHDSSVDTCTSTSRIPQPR